MVSEADYTWGLCYGYNETSWTCDGMIGMVNRSEVDFALGNLLPDYRVAIKKTFCWPSFGPIIGPSFGPRVKLKNSYLQTAQIAILWAQNVGLRGFAWDFYSLLNCHPGVLTFDRGWLNNDGCSWWILILVGPFFPTWNQSQYVDFSSMVTAAAYSIVIPLKLENDIWAFVYVFDYWVLWMDEF